MDPETKRVVAEVAVAHVEQDRLARRAEAERVGTAALAA
jgi:hypothetical protein